jgi:hypothetical protein
MHPGDMVGGGVDDFYDDDPVESMLGEFVWDCGNKDCCMNFQPHYRSECYTPDEYEAYVTECLAAALAAVDGGSEHG